ncbi:MAG: topology modulation protein [Oscillospiraceae bacterium]|nr:topology modulation protein [Oscillospiraceae bacterium]
MLGKRIMVLGSSGSGKSTLASTLGKITGIEVIHIDRLFWNPGWVETPDDELDQKIKAVASGDSWIIDGNYSRTLDFRLERADSIIFIDFSRYFCIFRVLKRRIKYHGKTRDDLGEGLPEKVDRAFLAWIWNWPKRSRGKTLEKIAASGKIVYILKSRKDVRLFVKRARAG